MYVTFTTPQGKESTRETSPGPRLFTYYRHVSPFRVSSVLENIKTKEVGITYNKKGMT